MSAQDAIRGRPGRVILSGAVVVCEQFDREPCPHQPVERCSHCPGRPADPPAAQAAAQGRACAYNGGTCTRRGCAAGCQASGLIAPPAAQDRAGADAPDYSADLTRAKNLLVRLWDHFPEARSMIEGHTGSWFVWGVDRGAPAAPPAAAVAPAAPLAPSDADIRTLAIQALPDAFPFDTQYTFSDTQLQGFARAVLAKFGGAPLAAQQPLTEAQIDSLNGLDTPTRVRFYEHDFYVLSNFSAFNLEWKGHTFPTSEHAYHWEKFARDAMDQPGGRSDIAYLVRTAPSAHEAFKIAERNRAKRRADWDGVKVGIMRDILRAKAAQHEYVRRKLLATGSRELVEDSWRDDFWGWGPNRDGKNKLGRLWMEIRAELQAAHGITNDAGATGAGGEG